MTWLGPYCRHVLLALDELGNTLLGGSDRETISSRLGRMARGDYGPVWRRVSAPAHWAVDFVALHVFGQRGHCADAILPGDDVGDLLGPKNDT